MKKVYLVAVIMLAGAPELAGAEENLPEIPVSLPHCLKMMPGSETIQGLQRSLVALRNLAQGTDSMVRSSQGLGAGNTAGARGAAKGQLKAFCASAINQYQGYVEALGSVNGRLAEVQKTESFLAFTKKDCAKELSGVKTGLSSASNFLMQSYGNLPCGQMPEGMGIPLPPADKKNAPNRRSP